MSQSLIQWQKALPPLKHLIGSNPASSKPKATKGKAPPAETDRAAMFKRVDRDHNGLITRAEHLLNFKGREAEGKSRFDSFDTNHDDQLTPEEFIQRRGAK
jgi:hypothetical protein